MDSWKLKILSEVLTLMARLVLRRRHPIIIGVTGSVGKTSTKEAVALVLARKFKVRSNEKNYNNEIGLPLSIIGAESGNRSIKKWLAVFFRWLWALTFDKNYPDILILEMGVDRPGDMINFLRFIKPTVGIVTNIGTSHLEYFKNQDGIAREKGKLAEILPEDGAAILNGDDERTIKMGGRTKAEALTFGFGEKTNFRATDVAFNYRDGYVPEGITFKLNYEGKIIPVRLRHILAPHQISAALAAVAAGVYFKINLVDIATALEKFATPCGRMNLIPGIKGSWIIDDTYNASPVSTLAALDALKNIKAKRKIAVLGDMLELGGESMRGHLDVGEKTAQSANAFFAVGRRMEKAVEAAKIRGLAKENIFCFSDPESAGRALQNFMAKDDLILVKGSQGMRMEKVMEEVMAEPTRAEELLCRQNEEWKSKKFALPE